MESISLLGMLGWCSIDDIRYKQIRVILVALFGIAGIVFHLYFGRLSLWNMLGGAFIGAVLYVISVLSHEKIGKGDALMVAVTGIYLGLWYNLILLWVASLMVAIFGFFATLKRCGRRNFEVPFSPFLLIGYILLLCLWGGRIAA